jgi:5-methylcytosine-specific restriction endonuclease McrA
MRSVDEWIGKTDDSAIPPRVRLRVFTRADGRCAHCGLAIRGSLTPAYDHINPLINGGPNRESNIQLLCVPCHKLKTVGDVAEKAVVYRKRLKAVGIKKRKRTIPGRHFDGRPIFSRWK